MPTGVHESCGCTMPNLTHSVVTEMTEILVQSLIHLYKSYHCNGNEWQVSDAA